MVLEVIGLTEGALIGHHLTWLGSVGMQWTFVGRGGCPDVGTARRQKRWIGKMSAVDRLRCHGCHVSRQQCTQSTQGWRVNRCWIGGQTAWYRSTLPSIVSWDCLTSTFGWKVAVTTRDLKNYSMKDTNLTWHLADIAGRFFWREAICRRISCEKNEGMAADAPPKQIIANDSFVFVTTFYTLSLHSTLCRIFH